MTDNKVEGWTNYETWNLALWINNDQQAQKNWREQAKKALAGVTKVRREFTQDEEAAFVLAEVLKDFFEDRNPLANGRCGFYQDILTAAIGAVNWYEVAKSLIDAQIEESNYQAAN